jgi:hypothetical protein
MGSRRALVVGTSGYLLFIAANLAPSWYAPRLNRLSLSLCSVQRQGWPESRGDPCVASSEQ